MSAKKLIPELDERNFAGGPAFNSWQPEVLGGESMETAFLTSMAVTGARLTQPPARLNPSTAAAFHSAVKCDVATNFNL